MMCLGGFVFGRSARDLSPWQVFRGFEAPPPAEWQNLQKQWQNLQNLHLQAKKACKF